MRWTEPNHFRHCWLSETFSSVSELLLTLKSSLCLLGYISDLCLLLPVWSICFCHAAAWAVLPHGNSQGHLCAVLGVSVTLTVLSAHQTDTHLCSPPELIRWTLLHVLLSPEYNSNLRQYNPVLTLILIWRQSCAQAGQAFRFWWLLVFPGFGKEKLLKSRLKQFIIYFRGFR